MRWSAARVGGPPVTPPWTFGPIQEHGGGVAVVGAAAAVLGDAASDHFEVLHERGDAGAQVLEQPGVATGLIAVRVESAVGDDIDVRLQAAGDEPGKHFDQLAVLADGDAAFTSGRKNALGDGAPAGGTDDRRGGLSGVVFERDSAAYWGSSDRSCARIQASGRQFLGDQLREMLREQRVREATRLQAAVAQAL